MAGRLTSHHEPHTAPTVRGGALTVGTASTARAYRRERPGGRAQPRRDGTVPAPLPGRAARARPALGRARRLPGGAGRRTPPGHRLPTVNPYPNPDPTAVIIRNTYLHSLVPWVVWRVTGRYEKENAASGGGGGARLTHNQGRVGRVGRWETGADPTVDNVMALPG